MGRRGEGRPSLEDVSPYLKYTVLRLGLFVVVLGVLAVLGARGWLLVLLAAVVSMALSFVVLGNAREEMTTAIAARTQQRTTQRRGRLDRAIDEDAAAEDSSLERPPADGDR